METIPKDEKDGPVHVAHRARETKRKCGYYDGYLGFNGMDLHTRIFPPSPEQNDNQSYPLTGKRSQSG